jgi:FkbM family methyltransferase
MPVTEIPEHIVVWAYRLILGRDAESAEVIRSWQSMGDPRLLTQHFTASPEHRHGRADPNFVPLTRVVPDAVALDAWHWLRHGRPAPPGATPIRSFVALREALLREWPEPPALEPDEALVDIEGRSFRLRGPLDDPYMAHAGVEAHMLERLARVARALLPDGGARSVLVDGGANLGLSALALAAGVPSHARLLAFEPNPRIGAMLRDNLARNGLDRAEVQEAALGAQPGEVLLHDPSSPAFAFVAPAGEGVGVGVQHQVPCVTLDDVARGFPRLDLVKLDIEGAEMDAIKGGMATFRRLGTLVYVELNIWTQLRFAGANPLRVLEAWGSWFPHVVRFTEAGPRPVVGLLAQRELVHDILMSPNRHDDIVLCFDLAWTGRW